MAFSITSALVLGTGALLQETGALVSSNAMMVLAGVAGTAAALVGGLCTFRMNCYGKIVEVQNSWRPGEPLPNPISECDAALLQAASVEATLAHARRLGRTRNREIVARLSSVTANRINNALTVVLGSLEIAEQRGFGEKFQREASGIREGVKDIRQVCTRLLSLSTHGGRQVRRLELGSHLRSAEPQFLGVLSNDNRFSLVVEDAPIRVQVSPKRLTDWLCRALQVLEGQCGSRSEIRMVARHDESMSVLPVIELQAKKRKPLAEHPQLQQAAWSLGCRMESTSLVNGRQAYRLLLESQEFVELEGHSNKSTAGIGTMVEASDVLLVEDDEQVRRLLGWMLERRGNSIVEMDDGEKAWAFMEGQGESIRFAIIDLVIPGVGGVELAQRIRTHYPEVGILLVTGHDGEEGMEFIRNDPMVALLRKPFGEKELEVAADLIERDRSSIESVA
ncbi:MAG: response regulator [Phycisphaerales bacterium]|nr:response regulator [Phycisphaerales bacterium]